MNVVIIPAGGVGKRMGGDAPKQFAPLAGKPVLAHTLQTMQQCPGIDAIIVASIPEFRDRVAEIARESGVEKLLSIVDGGDSRQDSVWNALKVAPTDAEIILVHDAVRPLVRVADIAAVIASAIGLGAAILATPVKDTIKQTDEEDFIENTLDRDCLWAAQTPQAFRRELLINAFKRAMSNSFNGTDEASLIEYSGGQVKIVPGAPSNIKITTPEDLVIAEALLGVLGTGF